MSDRDERDIEQLVLRFADALNLRDADSFAAVWADEGTWAIDPPTGFTFTGTPAEMHAVFEQRISRWAGFVQLVHGTLVTISGDTATSRSYLTEIGEPAEGETGYANHGMYLDELTRTSQGWRFRRRSYHYLYLDKSPLRGQTRKPPTSGAHGVTVGG